jgi:hypothetical protein
MKMVATNRDALLGCRVASDASIGPKRGHKGPRRPRPT